MNSKIYWLNTFDNFSRIGIMARPRSGEWLGDEIQNLKRQNVGILVSLLEKNEIVELGLENEEQICSDCQIEFINFPIRDRSIPKNSQEVDRIIDYLSTCLKDGITVVVHCRMGIGRSSIIASSILMSDKRNVDELLESISSIRGLKVPDTDEQVKWLRSRQ